MPEMEIAEQERHRQHESTGYKHHASCGNLSCTGHGGLQCGDLETGGDYVRYAGGIFRSRISVEAAYERRIPQVPAVYGQCI